MTDHLITDQLPWAVARVAPASAPMRAWLELEGMPNFQVIRFQLMAPSKAQRMVPNETHCGSTRPEATVLATAVPAKAPKRSKVAASRTACPGVRTRVAILVATALALSFKPFMNSKMTATST